MANNVFGRTLEAFKQKEQPEAVLLVASHKDYANIAAAWMHLEVRRKRRFTKRPADSGADAWAWLWENVCFSEDTLIEKSGVPEKRFAGRLNTLIANRALYPDGSVNSFVRRYLHERVLKLLGVDAPTRRELRLAASRDGFSG
jgi:hypothetical protein